ncbi:MAG: hypothetical protein ACE5JD_15365 [Candidatus Methylomirabilia bacterium]
MSLFADLEDFVHARRACGEMTADAEEPTPHGYRLWVWCSCGTVFDRWVSPEDATEDSIRSGLLAFPK